MLEPKSGDEHLKSSLFISFAQETADLVTFTDEILNGELQFFMQCSMFERVLNKSLLT